MTAPVLTSARAPFPRKRESILRACVKAKLGSRLRGNDEQKTSKAKANA